jgi:multicomponent K+:H+ antiporter subunit E
VNVFKKVILAPLTSAALLVLWLVLARTRSAGQLVLGLILALAIPRLTSNLRLTRVRVRRPLVIVRFIFTVGYDVVASNFEVAWGTVAWLWRRPRARFVIIPLELRDPAGLSALAVVTTVVPGTIWSELSLDRSSLLLHVWDVEEESAFVSRFKARYEKPLREIFE